MWGEQLPPLESCLFLLFLPLPLPGMWRESPRCCFLTKTLGMHGIISQKREASSHFIVSEGHFYSGGGPIAQVTLLQSFIMEFKTVKWTSSAISYVHTLKKITDTMISSVMLLKNSLKVIQWWATINIFLSPGGRLFFSIYQFLSLSLLKIVFETGVLTEWKENKITVVKKSISLVILYEKGLLGNQRVSTLWHSGKVVCLLAVKQEKQSYTLTQTDSLSPSLLLKKKKES